MYVKTLDLNLRLMLKHEKKSKLRFKAQSHKCAKISLNICKWILTLKVEILQSLKSLKQTLLNYL